MTIINFSDVAKSIAGSGSSHVSSSRHTAYYCGLVYVHGHTAGRDSVERYLAELETTSVRESAHQLRGAFGLFIHDRADDSLFALVDNGGLYKVFRHGAQLSNSFLRLVKDAATSDLTIVDSALVEFMAHGFVLGRDTFVEEIKKIGANDVVRLSHGNGAEVDVVIETKAIPKAASSLTTSFESLSTDAHHALSGASLSADLTGGFDSRLLVSDLAGSGLDFELAISGTGASNDVQIASAVASRLDRKLEVTTHEIQNIDDELADVFVLGDGQTDPVRFHRLRQLDAERRRREVDTIVYGGGGELYKDFHLLQDFPTRGRRAPNFDRYYALRVAPIDVSDWLSEKGVAVLEGVRARTLSRFRGLGEETNVRGYLRAHYELRSPEFYGRTISNHVNLGLDVYAPFLEREIFEASLDMPFSLRLMNRWHRTNIAKRAPQIHDVPTTEGYSSRVGIRFLRDLPKYVGLQVRRVGRKIAQRTLGRSLFLSLGSTTNDNTDLLDEVRHSALVSGAFDALHDRGLVRASLEPRQVGEIHVGRFTLVGMFLRYLSQGLPVESHELSQHVDQDC